MSEKQEEEVLPLRVFYSYAQEDEALCQILEKHLSLLRHEGKIVEWSRHKILPGADLAQSVDQNLLSASLILLLISPDFLASDYCYGQDMQQALERHKSGSAHVIPILLRPADWEKAPFAHLQYLPRNAQPITLWSNQDEAFQVLASEIRRSIEEALSTPEIVACHASSAHINRQSPSNYTSSKEDLPITASTNTRHFLYKYDAHAEGVSTVAWSPDGTRIASGSVDKTVHVWQAATGHHLLTYRHHKHFLPNAVVVVRWSPDSKYIASGGSKSGKIYVWDALSGQNITTYEGHSLFIPGIFSLAWSPDGRFITSSNLTPLEALAHIWDALSGRLVLKIKVPKIVNDGVPGIIAWSPDGTRIAAKYEKKIYICHAKIGNILLTFTKHSKYIIEIAWSQDNQWIISVQTDEMVVWNAITGVVLLSYEKHLGPLCGIALSPNGKYVASASEDRTVHVWELLTGKLRLMYTGHSDYVTSVTWSPDSTRIASASSDKSVHIWRTLLDE